MTEKNDWKHGKSFPIPTTNPDAIAIFDDELPGQDAIYKRHGTRFCPCRTVTRSNLTHWKNVLSAWSLTAPLEDHRHDRTTPLP